jgi:dCMP deaminase
MISRWTNYFFELAAATARMSRDPNTQVGAVIVRPDKTIASLGFNGFARGVDDDEKLYADRDTKLRRVVHAEMNAILTAREPLHGYTLYVRPLPPCPHCAGAIIQAGIKKIVWSGPEVPERWAEDMAEAMKMFAEAGVEVERVVIEHVESERAEDPPVFYAVSSDVPEDEARSLQDIASRVYAYSKTISQRYPNSGSVNNTIATALADLIISTALVYMKASFGGGPCDPKTFSEWLIGVGVRYEESQTAVAELAARRVKK